MVNITDFTKRLQVILQEYELSAAGFAQKIEVGRASISHILSGRNKPSLDFVMKVVSTFPEVDLYWLLNGEGNFPKTLSPTPPSLFSETSNLVVEKEIVQEVTPKQDLDPLEVNSDKRIDKIVILYSDGSFESYKN